MSGPTLTIVTISFNAGEALRRTIESVNGQNYPLIEHVFVDGGSTDGSVELIRSLARREARWVSEPDEGIADAFNKGTRNARGDYICYLNAGDTFAADDVLSRVAAHIRSSEGDADYIYYGDFISVSGGVERTHRTSSAIDDFAWDNPINHQSAFIPRQLATAFPYDNRLTLGMDYDLWLRVHGAARFRRLPFPIAVFELGGRSSCPAWEVHGLVMHRILWHINRGSRIELWDLVILGKRALRFKLNAAVRLLLGKRLSLAVRATKTRRLERSEPSSHRFA